jgi:hypothetical protein
VHAEGRIAWGRRDIKLGRLEVELEVDVLILVQSKLLMMLWVKGMLLIRWCGLHGEWSE